MHLSCTAMETQRLKDNGVMNLTFEVTWRHRSCDHLTHRKPLPMGSPLWPSIRLAPIWRYGATKIMGLQPWPFGVTWRHWSRDRSIRGGLLHMSGPLWPTDHDTIMEIWHLKDNGSRPWSFGVMWCHQSHDHSMCLSCTVMDWRYEASNVGQTHARTLRWSYTLSI